MPRFCGVINCGNRGDRDSKKFFRLPAELSRGCEKRKELSRLRRQKWINALKRADLTETKLKYLLICEDHFISGQPAELYDQSNPDWIPSKQMGYENPIDDSVVRRYDRFKKRQIFNCPIENEESIENMVEDSPSTTESEVNTSQKKFEDRYTQTDISMKDIDNLYKSVEDYVVDIVTVRDKLKKLEINEDSFKDDDEKTKYYTGIPMFYTLNLIFMLIKNDLPAKTTNSLTKFQQFMLCMMRLRLNLDLHDLAYRYGVCQTTASKVFYTCLFILFSKLKSFIVVWPERDVLISSMPELFLETFNKKITVIIDCFEIQIEKPSNLLAAAQTWSNYKHRHTIKLLIGICPQGAISFISKAWGGRTSDKYLTENCGFLEKLVPGDLVVADRGFNIKDSVNLYCAEVMLPAFTKGKKQLSALEVEQTRKIANVRIHVERVIGSLRQKYRILDATMPIRLLCKNYSNGISVVDQIVTVCCALVNICPSVIAAD